MIRMIDVLNPRKKFAMAWLDMEGLLAAGVSGGQRGALERARGFQFFFARVPCVFRPCLPPQ